MYRINQSLKSQRPKNNFSHQWDLSIPEAKALQEKLRASLQARALPLHIRFVAGADVSFNKFEKDVYAGVIVLSYPELVPLEHAVVKVQADFPYVPGYLSFREIPPLLQCWKLLKTKPDVVVVDGHGIAHPRRLGIAAHFGLVADVPTIGVAKNILYGAYTAPPAKAGGANPIIDPKTGEEIGTAFRSKNNVKEIFISPGNYMTTEGAVSFIQTLIKKHRVPETTRFAHNLVNAFRKGECTPGFFRY